MATNLMTAKVKLHSLLESVRNTDWMIGDCYLQLIWVTGQFCSSPTSPNLRKLEEDSVTLDDVLQTLDEVRKEVFKERHVNIGSSNSQMKMKNGLRCKVHETVFVIWNLGRQGDAMLSLAMFTWWGGGSQ